ncbi:uncharacterized protein LOC144821551 isoform X5 [Lissotriton helveticus]
MAGPLVLLLLACCCLYTPCYTDDRRGDTSRGAPQGAEVVLGTRGESASFPAGPFKDYCEWSFLGQDKSAPQGKDVIYSDGRTCPDQVFDHYRGRVKPTCSGAFLLQHVLSGDAGFYRLQCDEQPTRYYHLRVVGESKRSTAEVREKRREGAGPSTSHGGQDQEQAAPIPEEATAENPQSPLLFGSQDTGAAELSPTPTSPSPVLGRVRSHDVPPRRILQTSSEEDEVEGDTQDRGNTEQQPSPRVTRASVRGRRPREVEDVRQVQGVFCGREATMVKVQRLQAKAMMGVQRHARTTNNKLEAVGKGIGEMAESMQSMASGISDITQCMTVLCDKLDRDHLERRKARVDVRQQTKALNRFATATTVLCRRSVTMQDAIVQCCNNLSEGMARMTSAMELVLAHQTGTGGDTCAAESEGSTSRSGASTPVHELRRSGRRGGSVTGQREDIDSQPQQPRPVARGHKQ